MKKIEEYMRFVFTSYYDTIHHIHQFLIFLYTLNIVECLSAYLKALKIWAKSLATQPVYGLNVWKLVVSYPVYALYYLWLSSFGSTFIYKCIENLVEWQWKFNWL